ncbi:MAG: hypothetical protein KF787_05460 [Phycisphaeraceae bacterium]|nr:hypothetical protein [Phycisphaerae bacterium]MBX3392078.1 hypothetical protein [Phycisphaeraceae bacterium]HRJ48910.1 hypothetical protein [Phycisphaerales bacterium]
MFDSIKPGQTITCTITKAPRGEGRISTIERLMRRDPANAKALRRGHRRRQQTLNVYNRGNRDWTSRVPCAKVVRVVSGQSWTMTFTADLLPDFKSVEQYLSVKSA